MESMKLSKGSKIQFQTLPCDIVFDILSRLCIKTLCKSRCVSKSWRDLISCPDFIDRHQRRSKQNPLLLLTYFSSSKKLRLVSLDKEGNVVSEFHVPYQAAERFLLTVPTCLQLACVYGYKTAYICNPAMGELIPLPESSAHHNDNLRDQWTVVFGYVRSTKVYKVLRLFKNTSEDYNRLNLDSQIISVRVHDNNRTISCDERWRAVDACPFTVCYNAATVVNGYVHMMPGLYCAPENSFIVRFDLEREEWSVLRPPWLSAYTTWEYQVHEVFLRELTGQLCVAFSPESRGLNHMDIWLLKDYERGEWVKQYNIDISSFRCDHLRYFSVVPLSIEEDGRLLMEITTETTYFSNHDRKRFVYYDPESKGFQTIFRAKDKLFTTTLYIESFLSSSQN